MAALAPIADKAIADYLADAHDELVAERLLERIIGRMIDVNYRLLVEDGPPADDDVSFIQLAPLRVYDAEFARKIAACAGLPNRIVHEYGRDRSEQSARGGDGRDARGASLSARGRGVRAADLADSPAGYSFGWRSCHSVAFS